VADVRGARRNNSEGTCSETGERRADWLPAGRISNRRQGRWNEVRRGRSGNGAVGSRGSRTLCDGKVLDPATAHRHDREGAAVKEREDHGAVGVTIRITTDCSKSPYLKVAFHELGKSGKLHYMQLPIETWLNEQTLPAEAAVAFDEAIRSYKANAYRAALLFSYVGWNLVIRRRILTAKCPNGMPPQRWRQIQTWLTGDDSWDDKTFDCTQAKDAPAPIFIVPDGLREEVKYWKNRRNDCAHFKLNEITGAHVESFWAFVRSNMSKFVPNGSIEDLLDRVAQNFDPNYNPPGTSVRPIISGLPTAVLPFELPRFFDEVSTLLSIPVGGTRVVRVAEVVEVVEESLRLDNRDITGYLKDYLQQNVDLQLAVLRKNPSRAALWKDRPQAIRSLWHERLFTDGHKDLHVYIWLLRNELIPEVQRDEANLRVAHRMGDEVPKSEEDIAALRNHRFFDALTEWCFAFQDKIGNRGIDSFDWGNSHTNTIAWLFSYLPTTEDLVSAVCHTFISRPYPDDVRNAIRAFYNKHPDKKAEFVSTAEKLELPLPKSIFVPRTRLDGED
jgi:hypothetical protein